MDDFGWSFSVIVVAIANFRYDLVSNHGMELLWNHGICNKPHRKDETCRLQKTKIVKYQQVESGHDAVIDTSLLPAEGRS